MYAVQWQMQIVGGNMRKVVEIGGHWWSLVVPGGWRVRDRKWLVVI